MPRLPAGTGLGSVPPAFSIVWPVPESSKLTVIWRQPAIARHDTNGLENAAWPKNCCLLISDAVLAHSPQELIGTGGPRSQTHVASASSAYMLLRLCASVSEVIRQQFLGQEHRSLGRVLTNMHKNLGSNPALHTLSMAVHTCNSSTEAQPSLVYTVTSGPLWAM